jgi:hypothetical protein
MAEGIQLILPIPSESSKDGIISDHTDAATITPAAKPSNMLCMRADTSRRAKSTIDAPIIVPIKGISIMVKIFIVKVL